MRLWLWLGWESSREAWLDGWKFVFYVYVDGRQRVCGRIGEKAFWLSLICVNRSVRV